MRVRDAVVVITGASSGIGRATALAFARRGCPVVLAARREEALERVRQECQRHRDTETLVVPLDVTDPEAVTALARRTVERFGRVDVWVNNAAVAVFGPFQEVPLRDLRRVWDVNVLGYVHGARAALPVMREQGHGTLVNVSSVVGAVAQPYTHAYGMSQHAVRALGTGLRQELRLEGPRGVRVCTVLPATVDTPLFARAANYTGRQVRAMPPVHSPERVARAIVGLVRRPRPEVVIGLTGRALVLQARTTPRLAHRLMARRVDRAHLARGRPAPAGPGNLHQPPEDTGATHGGWRGRRRTAARRLAVAVAAAGAVGAIAGRGGRP